MMILDFVLSYLLQISVQHLQPVFHFKNQVEKSKNFLMVTFVFLVIIRIARISLYWPQITFSWNRYAWTEFLKITQSLGQNFTGSNFDLSHWKRFLKSILYNILKKKRFNFMTTIDNNVDDILGIVDFDLIIYTWGDLQNHFKLDFVILSFYTELQFWLIVTFQNQFFVISKGLKVQ